MRASPTGVLTDTTIQVTDNYAGNYLYTATLSTTEVNSHGGRFNLAGYSGALTQGRVYSAYNNTDGHFILFSAEL